MESPTTLQRNLEALAAVSPELADRLCWPVASDHVHSSGGRTIYRLHQSDLPLDLDGDALARLGAAAPPGANVLLFGVGTGDAVAALLAAGAGHLTAWDRDPWLLRRMLAEADFSAALAAGRLELLLGSDLLGLRPRRPSPVVVDHPTLAAVYHRERRLLDGPGGRPLALVAAGGLFVDDVASALEAEGHAVYTLDIQRLSLEEMRRTVERHRPALLAAINYTQGLGDFCASLDLSLLCWEIDPAYGAIAPLERPSPRLRVFTYRRANVPAFRAAGFTQVEYLPLAADPERRRPVALSEAERARYQADVSFVGSSLAREVAEYEGRFVQAHRRLWPGRADEARALLADVLREQAADFSGNRVPEILARLAPDFVARADEDVVRCAAEVAAARKRWSYVTRLAPHGMRVWGDDGWRAVAGALHQGAAGHAVELTKVYVGSRINVDIGRLYQPDIVTMRVFDVLACGSLVLAEHSEALAELFEVGREVESYRTVDELERKVAHYLAHPAEAAAIAAAGRAAVIARHSVRARVRHMLDRLRT